MKVLKNNPDNLVAVPEFIVTAVDPFGKETPVVVFVARKGLVVTLVDNGTVDKPKTSRYCVNELLTCRIIVSVDKFIKVGALKSMNKEDLVALTLRVFEVEVYTDKLGVGRSVIPVIEIDF
jgi:hypothetical protein